MVGQRLSGRDRPIEQSAEFREVVGVDRRARLLRRQNRHRGNAGDLEHLRRPGDGPRRFVGNPVPDLADALGFQKLAIGLLGHAPGLFRLGPRRFGFRLGLVKSLFGMDLRGDLPPGAAIADKSADFVKDRRAADADMMRHAVVAGADVAEVAERLSGGEQGLVRYPLLIGDPFRDHLPAGHADQIEDEAGAVYGVGKPSVAQLGVLLPEPVGGDLGKFAKPFFAARQRFRGAGKFDRLQFKLDAAFFQRSIVLGERGGRRLAAVELRGECPEQQ